MIRSSQSKIRIWNDKAMYYLDKYYLIQEPGQKVKISCQINHQRIKTDDFMIGIVFKDQLIYEQDILNFTIKEKPSMTGVMCYSAVFLSYGIATADNIFFPFAVISKATVIGNIVENPRKIKKAEKEKIKETIACNNGNDSPKVKVIPDAKPETTEVLDCPKAAKKQKSEEVRFDKNNVIIYTDGSCIPLKKVNDTLMGYAGSSYIIKSGNAIKKDSYIHPDMSTNNRAELIAAILALKTLPKGCNVTLYSDSKYLTDAFNKGWINGWKRKGWYNSAGEEVKNLDLWLDLTNIASSHIVNWVWVKGHQGDYYNECCDKLALEAAKAAKDILEKAV